MPEKPGILIVDDRPENLFALQKLLARLDVDVFPASNGLDALALAAEHDFCTAIVDVQMPEMDGYELVELLRGNSSTATLPVIFVSAIYSDDYHHRKGYDAGAVDFITKPFAPEVLISKVKVFIALYRQRGELQNLVAELKRANDSQVQLYSQVVRFNQQLEAANKELNTFAHSVSHDLRAPLRAIDSYSRILMEDYLAELSPEAQACLLNVHKSVERMQALIDGLLRYSRLVNRPLNCQVLEMEKLAREALAEQLTRMPERQLQTQVDTLPDAWGDLELSRQIFGELINNALKFSGKRPVANLEISYLPESPVVYYVRDQGVGFDMRYADTLFEVCQRLHSMDEFDGAGIGLSIVRRIVERHNGKIWAEAAPDQGATFYFTLPTSAGPPQM